MGILFLPLLPSYLGGKGNGDNEHGVGLLGIFPSPVLLVEKGRPKIPDPQALPSSKVHSHVISLDGQ